MLVKLPIGFAKLDCHPFDCSPSESPGRLTIAWADVVQSGGVLVGSLYAWHTEGLSARNRRLLLKAGEVAVAHGVPLILSGDLNMEPHVLI